MAKHIRPDPAMQRFFDELGLDWEVNLVHEFTGGWMVIAKKTDGPECRVHITEQQLVSLDDVLGYVIDKIQELLQVGKFEKSEPPTRDELIAAVTDVAFPFPVPNFTKLIQTVIGKPGTHKAPGLRVVERSYPWASHSYRLPS